MVELKKNYSRRVLIRLIVLLALALLIIAVSLKQLSAIYLENQITMTGVIINGAIVALFTLGILKMMSILIRYQREENELKLFVQQMESDNYNMESGRNNSMIHQRHSMIKKLSRDHSAIDHGALASIVVAQESTLISFPKFINNILILSGVFGTIVSLSIALVGASDLLSSAEAFGQMGLVIHGMSTALSTTMTAIICYLFYGYFYMKLTDTQTYFLSRLEQVTSLYLLPHYAHNSDSLIAQLGGLINNMQSVVSSMQTVQLDYIAAGRDLHEAASKANEQIIPIAENISAIKQVLHEGFRLPQQENEKSE